MAHEYHLTNGSIDSNRSDDIGENTKESQGLLENNPFESIQPRYYGRMQHFLHIFVLYLAVIGLCAALLISDLRRQSSYTDLSQQVWSPAEEAIVYEVKDFDLWFKNKSPYMGYPTDEIDQRWQELYNFGISQIPKSAAEKLANATLPRPGSEDYLIELDVFHQLHCLNDLRKAFYPDRYPGKWPYKDGKVDYNSIKFMHWDHCIDALRQTLMCHGDISVLPFHINPINQNLVPELATRHTCRNFEKIQDWARARQADEYEVASQPGRGPSDMM